MKIHSLEELRTLRVGVVGAGVTGKALVDYLWDKCAFIQLFDEKEVVHREKSAATEFNSDLALDLAIVSPGWRPQHPLLLTMKENKVELVSEIDFAWQMKEIVAPAQRWIAVSGTNGKTTTINMIQSIFDAGNINGVSCGNVGLPVIAAVSGGFEFLALELSSFQLEWCSQAHFVAGAILNIAEDHIDWHGDFDAYKGAKLKIYERSERAVINLSDPELAMVASSISGERIGISLSTPAPHELGVVEELLVDRAFVSDPLQAEEICELMVIKPTVPHNVVNALTAAALSLSIGIDRKVIARGLEQFVIDGHRIQSICVSQGVEWIDDSKATNPHAAHAAVRSFERVIWIAGGMAKGASMDELVRSIAPRLKVVILIGRDAPIIERALQTYAPSVERIVMDPTLSGQRLMDDVVKVALAKSSSGDTVLLSPACASFDQFDSYSDRGARFAQAVNELVGT